MKIEAGKYYALMSGSIAKPIEREGYWIIGGFTVKPDGTRLFGGEKYVLREVTVTDVLPFPLEAGKQYNTTKPDGTPGPVVTLKASVNGLGWRKYAPFYVESGVKCVLLSGDVMMMVSGEVLYRITSPYVEPKPPTIAERLETWKEKYLITGKDYHEILRGIIADVKKLEATK